MSRAVVVGAGMGGLAAALRLARRGVGVTVLEARASAGGLASGLELEGLGFDAGPYVLLDRPGLEWVFHELGLSLADHVEARRIERFYAVSSASGPTLEVHGDLARTADGFERAFPGSGRLYTRFVGAVAAAHRRLQPLLTVSRPGPVELLRCGGWRHAIFLLRSLERVLASSGLPRPIRDALSIWTHVAAQRPSEAPSPMAFVPALVHGFGAWLPLGGMRAIPRALESAARERGVELRYAAKVRRILTASGRATGVELETGEVVAGDAVLSDAHGVGTYLELVDSPEPVRSRLSALPLQSPGVCAYLAMRAEESSPYLRFRLSPGQGLCRLLVSPGAVVPEAGRDGWFPARLIGPMDHAAAAKLGPEGQRAYLEELLAEDWWRGHAEVRVLARRTPSEWGSAYHLHRDSMNPVMTARLMRRGRLAHRSPYVRGLYLAGSSTHPGQWVSFCGISGILAADGLVEDLR